MFKNTIKNSLFASSFELAKSNPGKIGLVILFDAMFLVSFAALYRLSNFIGGNLFAPTKFSSLLIFIIFSIIYYLSILFLYSFFKYCILDFIKSLFGMGRFSFYRLSQFYLLNIIIILPTYIIFSLILDTIKIDYQPLIFLILGVPLSLLLYLVINLSHSFFYNDDSIKKSINKSLAITFTKVKFYRETILAMILAAIFLGALFLASGYLINLVAAKNYALYLRIYPYFKQSSIIVFDIVFYAVILINRISFYKAVKYHK